MNHSQLLSKMVFCNLSRSKALFFELKEVLNGYAYHYTLVDNALQNLREWLVIACLLLQFHPHLTYVTTCTCFTVWDQRTLARECFPFCNSSTSANNATMEPELNWSETAPVAVL
jgi:hypothetical protein